MTSGRPAADDPDVPSEVVGALSWNDLQPLRRLGAVRRIRPGLLGLPFVVAALVVGAWWARGLASAATDPLTDWAALAAWTLAGVAAVAAVLLPVALMRRVPDALASQPLLFAGLALGSLVALIDAVIGLWLLDLPTAAIDLTGFAQDVLPAIGLALVGLGLVRLRGRWPRRPWLLIAIVAVYLGLALLPAGILAVQAQLGSLELFGGGPSLSAILRALATSLLVWVAVDAWLDHEAPARFWGLLAIALPLRLVAAVFQVPQDVAVLAFQGDLGTLVLLPATLAGTLSVLATFVAYARYAPSPGQPAGSSLSAAELMQ